VPMTVPTEPVILLISSVPDPPAVAIDPAFWPAATSAFNLAPLKVRYSLEIETFVLVVVRRLRSYYYNRHLVVIGFALGIPDGGRVRGRRR
jgi:hypothetical protein